MTEYRIARRGRNCQVCSREFPPGEDFVSAVFERPEGSTEGAFERVDACPGCFAALGREPYSRWTTRLGEERGRGPILDIQMAQDFLVRLAREGSPERGSLMHLLALLLLRKRRVKLLRERQDADATWLDLVVRTGEGETEISVPARMPTAEERTALEAELARLFGLRAD